MTADRQQIHTRSVELTAFVRGDGLWDLAVTLCDSKTRTFPGGARDHMAGTPIHHLSLSLTVDTDGLVVAAGADMNAVPFTTSCPPAAADYQLLVGLNLFDGFRTRLKERIGARGGCRHLSEMALMLPTLAIQSFAGVVYPIRDDGTQTSRPSPLDGCRGLRVEGEAVRKYFPRWYVRADSM
jgi:hypothetical protein